MSRQHVCVCGAPAIVDVVVEWANGVPAQWWDAEYRRAHRGKIDRLRHMEAAKALIEIDRLRSEVERFATVNAWRAEWMERAARELRDANALFDDAAEAMVPVEIGERVWAFTEESGHLLAEYAGDGDSE